MRHLLVVLLLLLVPDAVWANKVALVIGNSKYVSVPELDNPENDSRAISRALALQGFDVIAANDLSRVEMRDTLREFRELADKSDVALVYYAGHGLEISGNNFLVPVDARLEDERDAELEMVELDLVLRQISGAKSLKMVVLDACRNNPFVNKMKRSAAGRSVNAGLGRIEFAEADTLIAYAAAAGEITPDGASGSNSPFTTAFLVAMQGPPTDVRRLLGRVRDNMRETVPGAAPFVYTSLGGGEFVINPNSPATAPVAPLPLAAPLAADRLSISEDFIRIDRSGTFQDWNDFLVRHEAESDHPLYAFALEKREALRNRPSETASPVVRAENPVAAAVLPPKEPETVPNPVATASLGLGVDENTLTPQPRQRNRIVLPPVMSDDEAARRLQVLLRDAGCYGGAIDGILGRGSTAALGRFSDVAGVSVPPGATRGGEALREAIALVEDHPDAACRATATAPKPAVKPARTPVQPAVVAPVAPAPQSQAPVAVAVPTPTAPPAGHKPGTYVPQTQSKSTRDALTHVHSQANSKATIIPEASREPRREKLVPNSPADCMGTRKKLFLCD